MARPLMGGETCFSTLVGGESSSNAVSAAAVPMSDPRTMAAVNSNARNLRIR